MCSEYSIVKQCIAGDPSVLHGGGHAGRLQSISDSTQWGIKTTIKHEMIIYFIKSILRTLDQTRTEQNKTSNPVQDLNILNILNDLTLKETNEGRDP